MSSETQITPFVKASTQLGNFLGMETPVLVDALKSQFFKGQRPDQVTDAQLATVIAVANVTKLNPLLSGMLYPYPNKNGGVDIIIGPDGIYSMLANSGDIVAQKDGGPAWFVEHALENGEKTCTAYINHRLKGLLKKKIWVKEWIVSSNPNWGSRPMHMSETRALKQCARQVIHGIPNDPDEQKLDEMLNVTGTGTAELENAAQPQRDAPPPRASGVAAAIASNDTPKRGPGRPKKAESIVEGELETATETKPAETASPAAATTAAPVSAPAAPEAPALAKATEPRTSLNAGEKMNALCTVVSFKADMVKKAGIENPSVIAEVDGEFRGKIYFIGGGRIVGDKDGPDGKKVPIVEIKDEAWASGKPLKLKLFGDPRKPKPDPKFPNDRSKDIPLPCTILCQGVEINESVAQTPPAEQATGDLD